MIMLRFSLVPGVIDLMKALSWQTPLKLLLSHRSDRQKRRIGTRIAPWPYHNEEIA
jgi:hypothetical protein